LAELLETSVDQLNTCDLLDLTPSRFHPELVSRFKEASEGVRPKLLEASLRKANGGEAVLELSFRRLPTNSGEPPLIQVFGRDLTLRRSLEEQLRHAQKMESMGRMAGGIAHDFNNLLTVINGFNQLARERLGPGNEVESELGEVRNAGERASRLTGQLLAFSRNQISDPVALEINSSIRELREISGRLLGESIELRLDLDTQSLWVLMDPTSFDQVLLNLVANARDAMPGGGTLCISTGLLFGGDSPAPTGLALPPGKYISIEVTDTGVGMDASTQSKIFDPFFTTKGPGKGTGLGLSTVLGCVERAHGRIWVHSSPNEGTCFQVVIPLTVPPQPSVPEVPVTAPRSAPCSIAVVEDEESVRGFIVSVLENSGHAVRPACSPDEALGWEESYWNQVELLVTDVKMPGSSGAALVESLRRRRPELAVLFVSGFSDGILEQSILDQRTIYLQKPFSVETLLAKVHAAVPRAVPSRSILVVDDDDGIRTYVHSILTGAGHRVACAKDGMEADRLLHSDSFEVLVTDIVMPGVGGLNFLKQAKDRFSIRNVIVASGAFGSESVPAAGNLGADAILAKPFTPRDILGAVERLL
jgi:signal transduction histidine kinase/DNA-binding response OmpR family regulator